MIPGYEQYSEERRLHWLSIFYRAIMNSPAFIITLYLAFTQNSAEDKFYIYIAIVAGIFTFPMIFLNWYFLKFSLSGKEIVIKSGVVSRRQRNIPLRRIQNIDISQNFLQRILGIARVQIETAGGAESEGVLEFVRKNDAGEIREIIRKFQSEVSEEKKETTAKTEYSKTGYEEDNSSGGPKLLFSMGIRQLIIFGMLRFRPVMLIFGVWLFSIANQFAIVPDMEDWNVDKYFQSIENLSVFETVLFIVAGIVSISLLSWIVDIILTVIKFYDFKLYSESNKLHTEYGLITRKKSTIPLKKLQMINVMTNPIRQMFGYYSLAIETAGFASASKGSESLIPLADKEEVENLTRNIFGRKLPGEFHPVSRKTIRRGMIKSSIVLIPFIAAAIYFDPWFWWVIFFIPLTYPAAYLRWKFRGYISSEDMIYIKQGVILRKISLIPVVKLQTINIIRTFFQRRLDLATLEIDTAAIGILEDAGIVDLDKEEAEKLSKDITDGFYRVTSS